MVCLIRSLKQITAYKIPINEALIDEISPCLASPETADKTLAEWLNFFSAGNHDDRTLVVAW